MKFLSLEEITKCQNDINTQGFSSTFYDLDPQIAEFVKQERWKEIDAWFLDQTQKEGKLFKFLSQFESFQEIEFIISIRDANNEWEEDGIWHDDGSRKLAFSLSLTPKEQLKQIEGGALEIRPKGANESKKIKPFPIGEMILFATGEKGFEHKINAVTKGRRIIIAGWCS